MGLLDNLVEGFTHHGQQQNNPQHSSQGPPPVSPPWYAEWDARDQRWLFVNQQTGERTFTYPGPGFTQQQGGYGNNQGAYNQSSYDPTGNYQREEHEKKHGGNGWKYAAAGAAGLAGGALLVHEGEEAKEHWDRDKYRLEEDKYRVENDVENFPQNAAGWTGEQVGRVERFDDRVENRIENFDDRVENKWDNAVDDVENFPENTARWAGEKVQEVEDIPENIENKWDNAVDGVENYGDSLENAYDEGRDERRYDDDNDY